MEHLTRAVNIITRCTGLYRDEALAEVGLTSCQVPYMMRICRQPGWTQEELARDLYVHKSSVTRTLAALENGGGTMGMLNTSSDSKAISMYVLMDPDSGISGAGSRGSACASSLSYGEGGGGAAEAAAGIV